MRKPLFAICAGLGVCFVAPPAFALDFACNIAALVQTTHGFLVRCANGYAHTDSYSGQNFTIDWFTADARLMPNANGITPKYTGGETFAAFQAMAILAYERNKPLIVSFEPGMKPGQLFDCWNENCRYASRWSVEK